jgi:16S rRNA (cytosine967-C5)-methyltransferase
MPAALPHLKTDSLAFALLGAARALLRVRNGGALPQALAAVFARHTAPPQARGAMQDIAYRSLRQLGTSDALLAALTDKPVAPPELRALLCCALALLHPAAGEHAPPYEPHTVVDQAVTAAASDPVLARAKGMVNAVLRRFLRERDTLSGALRENPVAHWNYPDWWIDQMRRAYPNHWEAILEAGNRAPPLTLRVNRRRSTPERYLARLAKAGQGGTRIGPDAVRLARALPVAQIPGFDDGEVSVQDAAAQLAAPLLDLQDGMRVLDACAAPGGKTGHLLECADLDVLALDSDAQRLTRIEENLRRLQLQATLRCGDAARRDWWDGKPFDRILADVPCTASGIVRRHPDIRWLRRSGDTTQLALAAAGILDNLWPMLRPGGKLLFVTCSLWPQESERQAAAFAHRHQALRLPAPGQLLPAADVEQDHDGLFYALFQKPAL